MGRKRAPRRLQEEERSNRSKAQCGFWDTISYRIGDEREDFMKDRVEEQNADTATIAG